MSAVSESRPAYVRERLIAEGPPFRRPLPHPSVEPGCVDESVSSIAVDEPFPTLVVPLRIEVIDHVIPGTLVVVLCAIGLPNWCTTRRRTASSFRWCLLLVSQASGSLSPTSVWRPQP